MPSAIAALPAPRMMQEFGDQSSSSTSLTASPPREDPATQAAIRDLLSVLPEDVLEEIKSGEIDSSDPAFLSGLMDHASRLSVADPRNGRKMLGKIIRLRKLIHRTLRDSDPDLATTATVSNEEGRTGRNAPCPCGSGRKFKQCCLRKA